jgi:hypothetical protein
MSILSYFKVYSSELQGDFSQYGSFARETRRDRQIAPEAALAKPEGRVEQVLGFQAYDTAFIGEAKAD